MKARKRYLITGAAIFCLLFVAMVLGLHQPATAGRSVGKQPINFSHKLHVAEMEMECSDCHRFYMERKVAGRPSIEICSECHSEAETSEQEKIVAYSERGEEIPWKRVYRLPKHVFFSHARHVAVGNLKCKICHGEVAAKNVPLRKPLVKISMKFCIKCHKQLDISTDCNSCHM